MGVWIKLFNDGSSEHGSDSDIINKQASWSRGRLDGIESVQIFEGNVGVVLVVPNTEWYQYDRYVALLDTPGVHVPTRVARVVQALIKPEHIGKRVNFKQAIGLFYASLEDTPSEQGLLVCKEHVGLWISIYVLINKQAGIQFCERGAFHGDQQISR